MIRTLKKRDFKEAQIDASKEQEKINKDQMIRIEEYSKTLLSQYQTWKKENNVPGIKY